jgi:hypothetical protein
MSALSGRPHAILEEAANRLDIIYSAKSARSLSYEGHHKRNLKTLRGAKSNALSLRRANCNPACPFVALVIESPAKIISCLAKNLLPNTRVRLRNPHLEPSAIEKE